MDLIPKINYSEDEKIDLFLTAARANEKCQEYRKNFNLCRAKIPLSVIQPDLCRDDAKKVIDCFLVVKKQKNVLCKDLYTSFSNCSKKNLHCEKILEEYIDCEETHKLNIS